MLGTRWGEISKGERAASISPVLQKRGRKSRVEEPETRMSAGVVVDERRSARGLVQMGGGEM